MKRFHQVILIASTFVASWLGMQMVHECGHVLGAWATDGVVKQVVLHPLTISRTDVEPNPKPLSVVWAGPIFGVLFPLALWGVVTSLHVPGSFVFRFFAGFCLIANGAYIAFGSLGRIGDCQEMLRHGSPVWQLWLFGAIAIPLGFCLWHRQGTAFGLGCANGKVDHRVAYATVFIAILLIAIGLSVGGQ